MPNWHYFVTLTLLRILSVPVMVASMANPPDRIGTRINLTIPPETVAAIDRLCAAGGIGRATFIRELLISMEAHILDLAESFELAKQNNVDAFGKLATVMRSLCNTSQQLELEVKRKHRAAMRKRQK